MIAAPQLAQLPRGAYVINASRGGVLDVQAAFAALATDHLAPARRDYASRVIVVWQRAVYGHDEVQPSIVYGLCDDFAAALGATSGARALEGAA